MMSRMGRAYRRRAAGGRATGSWALTVLRSRVLWLLLVVAALAAGVISYSFLSTGGRDESVGGTVQARVAPDITLASSTGPFRLADHRGEVMVLYFSFPG